MNTHTEHTFQSWDGSELFYRAWIPQNQSCDNALILFHRGHEHSGRLEHLAKELGGEELAVFAWDARGHGRSPGKRGDANEFYDLVKDVDAFVRHVTDTHNYNIENVAVLAHSVSAVVVSLWVHDFAPRIRAMILAAPAFRVKLYLPGAMPALRLLRFACGKLGKETPFIKSYVKGKMLTHDPDEAKNYDEDPLVSNQIAVNVLLGLRDGALRLVADAGAIHTPTLLLSAREDWVVKNEDQRKFFENLSSPIKRVEVYRGFYHSVFHEKERHLPIAAVRSFLAECYRIPVDRSSLIKADLQGYTKSEYQWLRAGLPFLSLKGVGYRLTRIFMKTIGRISEGVRIGLRTGFDSGQSLDYVYRNESRGVTPLGRSLDRSYLDSVGWTAIRNRKIHLEQALGRCVARVSTNGSNGSRRPVHVVDIAGGPGRCVMETIRDYPEVPIEALIRDWSEDGLEEGRKLADELGLTNVTHEKADAFCRESLRAITPKIDIGIVSGLYELFPDNDPVRNSIGGMADAIKPGGYLIYTNQPWHPQLELIAELLTNREGNPWVMRRRCQAEIDELVREAGFEKLDMTTDKEGIFTVSVARRIS